MTTGQLPLCMPTMSERFEQFHADNPHVYDTLVRLAHEWIQRTGGQKLGIKSLYERLRWDLAMTTTDPNFKLNDHFTAYYARLLMHENPEFRGLFELRVSEADEWLSTYRPAS